MKTYRSFEDIDGNISIQVVNPDGTVTDLENVYGGDFQWGVGNPSISIGAYALAVSLLYDVGRNTENAKTLGRIIDDPEKFPPTQPFVMDYYDVAKFLPSNQEEG